MPIPISEPQWLAIANAAAALPLPDRDQFVANVARELAGQPIGDGSVARAIAASFQVYWHPAPTSHHGGCHTGKWGR